MALYLHPTPLSSSPEPAASGGSRVVSAPAIEDSSPGAVHGAEFRRGPPGGEGSRDGGGGLGVAAAGGDRRRKSPSTGHSRAFHVTIAGGVAAFLASPGSPSGDLGAVFRGIRDHSLSHMPFPLPPVFLSISPLPSPLISVVPSSARSWKSHFLGDQINENTTEPELLYRIFIAVSFVSLSS